MVISFFPSEDYICCSIIKYHADTDQMRSPEEVLEQPIIDRELLADFCSNSGEDFFLNINYCNLKRNEIDDHEMCSLSICQQPLPHSLTALFFTHICYPHFQTSFIWKIRKIIKFLIEMTCESITVVMQRFSTIDNKNGNFC